MDYHGQRHDSGHLLVSGKALFIEDLPLVKGELLVGLVTSDIAKGIIESVNIKAAMALPGVAGIYSANDLACNSWGTISGDGQLLADKKVRYVGQPILIIAAESNKILQQAKSLIKIKIKKQKPILNLKQAIAKKSFLGPPKVIQTGNVELEFKKAPHQLSGIFCTQAQDHFYLESQAARASYDEGKIEIQASSQHPTEVQHVTAKALGMAFHQVVCKVVRMGGGFGGKESQAAPFGAYVGLVAYKTKKSARLILTKDEDMQITGKRHPFEFHYQLGFDDLGKILALKVHLFSDGGADTDLSPSILERAMLHVDNAYHIPNCFIKGQVCYTNAPSNTAFRGFGGPQAVAFTESMLEDVADFLKKDSLIIRKINLYQKGQKTPYGQEIQEDTLQLIFADIEKSCDYQNRKKQINKFNLRNDYLKKGLSITAVKFGISFTTRFLNQGNALVNVHTDGTVQVSTGATEMGQGVNAKIAQVVADSFGIPYSWVRVMPTSTEKNHNTSPTAASSGTDINGAAAKIACLKIKKRLADLAWQMLNGFSQDYTHEFEDSGEDYLDRLDFAYGEITPKEKNKKGISFKSVVSQAYLNRVSLGEYAHYKIPEIWFDKDTGKGRPFFYYTHGVACSEVLVDCLTGQVKVLQTDILMDLGRPINPGIDYGQVTGGFIQGMGWATSEVHVIDDQGRNLSHSPTTYKIPNIQDIPRIFNVRFLENVVMDKNIRGSKAVGEPPLLLGASVFCAIKNAINYSGNSFGLQLPASNEHILKYM